MLEKNRSSKLLPPRQTGGMVPALAIGALLLGAGCARQAVITKASFSKGFSCPPERVVVTKKYGRPYLPPPPPEIAGDPQRLAIYEHRDEVYWQAQGCNQEAFYSCQWSQA